MPAPNKSIIITVDQLVSLGAVAPGSLIKQVQGIFNTGTALEALKAATNLPTAAAATFSIFEISPKGGYKMEIQCDGATFNGDVSAAGIVGNTLITAQLGTLPSQDAVVTLTITSVVPNPVITTNFYPTSITAAGANLAGTVDPRNFPIESAAVKFEIATGSGMAGSDPILYDYLTPNLRDATLTGSRSNLGSGIFSCSVASLSPNTVYYYRISATPTGKPRVYGVISGFKTLSVVPTIVSIAPPEVRSNRAVVSATINSNNSGAYSYQFAWKPTGTSTWEYGSTRSTNNIGINVITEDGIYSLIPSTAYDLKLTVNNATGTSTSTNSFTTLIDRPIIATENISNYFNPITSVADNITQTGVRMHGWVYANGITTGTYSALKTAFQYGADSAMPLRPLLTSSAAGSNTITITTSGDPLINAAVGDKVIATGLSTTNSAEIFISAINSTNPTNLTLKTTLGNTFTAVPTVNTNLKFIVYTNPTAYVINTSLTEYGFPIFETITGLSANSIYHYRIVGFTGSATNYNVPLDSGANRTFTTLPGVVVPPVFVPVVPTFSEATDAYYAEAWNNFADLYGNISNFDAIQAQRVADSLPLLKYFFQYSTTPLSAGWDELTPHTTPLAVTIAAAGDISRKIEGLSANTKYYYRIGIEYVNAAKAPFTYYSNVQSFITTNYTSITTTEVYDIDDNYTYDLITGVITSPGVESTTGRSVVIRGSLNYIGLGDINQSYIATWFEYSYDSTISTTTSIAKARNFAGGVFAVLNNLDRSKTYHYRLVTTTTLSGAPAPTIQYGDFITIPATAAPDSIATGGTENVGTTGLNITGVLNSTSRTDQYLFTQYVRAAHGIDISISDSVARASLNSLPSWTSPGVQRTTDVPSTGSSRIAAGIDSYYYETQTPLGISAHITTSMVSSTASQLHAVIVTLAAANSATQSGQQVTYSTSAAPSTYLTMGSNISVHSVSGTEVILISSATANYFNNTLPVAGDNIRFALNTTPATYATSVIGAITPRDVAFSVTLASLNTQIAIGQIVTITNANPWDSTSLYSLRDVLVHKIEGANLIIKSAAAIAPPALSTPWALSFSSPGVTAGKKYYYRVCASSSANGAGVVMYGDTRYFIAGLGFPTATTVDVATTDNYVTQPAAGTGYFKDRARDISGLAPLTAKLKGTINTGYHSTRWWFEYQPSPISGGLPTFTSSDIFWTTKNDTYPPLFLESWLPAYAQPNDYYFNNSQVDHQYNSTTLATTSSLSFMSAAWRQMRTIGTGPYSIELEVGGYGDGGIDQNKSNILTAGLKGNTRYAYRLVTETNEYEGVTFSLNSSENLAPYNQVNLASPYKVYGEVKYFTTPPRPGVVAHLTNNAGHNTTNITKNSATIAAGINLGDPVLGLASCFFEYEPASPGANFAAVPPVVRTPEFATGVDGMQSANITGLSPATIYHYRLAIKPYGETAYVLGTPGTMQIQEFKTSNADMAITNIISSHVLGNSARINARITSNGKPAQWIVKYGTINGAPNKVSATQYITTNLNGDVDYSVNLSGLSPGTQYYYRLYVSNQDDSVASATYNFTTPGGLAAVAPVISGSAGTPHVYAYEPAEYSHATDVTLWGVLNSNGDTATSYYFEYGLQPGKYTTKTEMKVVVGQIPQTVSEDIINLNPDSVYYYRLVGKNNIGTTYGVERAINDRSGVKIKLDNATDITPVHATLHGNINLSVKANISYQFQYDITDNFSNSTKYKFTPARIIQDLGSNIVSMLIKDLVPDTIYYYRLVIDDGRSLKVASEIKSFVANTTLILEKENPRIGVGKIVSGGNIMASSPPITVSKVFSRKKVITLSGINLVNTPNAILIVTPTTPLIFT